MAQTTKAKAKATSKATGSKTIAKKTKAATTKTKTVSSPKASTVSTAKSTVSKTKAAGKAKSAAKAVKTTAKAPAKKTAAKSATTTATKKATAAKNATSTKAAAAAKKPAIAQKTTVAKATKAAQATSAARKQPAAKSGAARRASASAKPVRSTAASAGKAAAAPKSQPTRSVAASVAKSANSKISAPVSAGSKKPSTPKDVAKKAAEKKPTAPAAAAAVPTPASKKPVSQRHGFKTNEFVVYPAHGVGRIMGIEEQEIAGMALELFVINFEKEKLTLRVPTGKLESVGMRKLSDEKLVRKAMDVLKGRARVKRTMWSRRAQEYVAKITSGDLISIAEVVRDLYRSDMQPEQSYSERQLYEDALDRMARELAAVERIDDRSAVQRITEVLSKSAKGRRAAEEEALEDEGEGSDSAATQAA